MGASCCGGDYAEVVGVQGPAQRFVLCALAMGNIDVEIAQEEEDVIRGGEAPDQAG